MISFCEIPLRLASQLIDDLCGQLKQNYREIYIGSEFCYRKLLDYSLKNLEEIITKVHKLGCKLYFIFPIVPDRYIFHFQRIVEYIDHLHINGIIVNDYGAMYYISKRHPNIPIGIGRLLVKNSRDYIPCETLSRIPEELVQVKNRFRIFQVHYDVCLENIITDGIPFLSHKYMYITSSMSCEYKKNKDHNSYVVDGICNYECQRTYVKLNKKKVYRIGNAIISRNENISNAVLDYGIDFILQVENENNGPAKSDI